MWRVGREVVVRKSRFVGRAAHVDSLTQTHELLKMIKKETTGSTHNIMACRVAQGSTSVLEEANDNGEPPAARRILQIMQRSNIVNMMVVVSRWYGGTKLGPERFRVIDECTRQILENKSQ